MTNPQTPLGSEQTLLVHAYVDGELDPANALAVGRQIAADPALQAEANYVQALRSAVRDKLPREPLPPHLRPKIDALVGGTTVRASPTWRLLAASVVCALALGSGSTWLAMHTPMAADRTAEAVVDGHMRSLMAAQPTEVASSERHTVKPWFNGRIPQSPQVIDLSKDGYPLVGGRVDVVDTVPVATLTYKRRLHVISLTEVPQTGAAEQPALRGSVKGYNVVRWARDGVTYWAASDLNANELKEFAGLFDKAVSDP
jgi:anti-sigma factor RsiW